MPYVSKLYTGSVAGLVGAGELFILLLERIQPATDLRLTFTTCASLIGGNAGSVVFSFGFRGLDYRDAFIMMGSIVMASSFTTFFIKIPCHAGLITGQDNHAVINARERHLQRLQYEANQSDEEVTENNENAASPAANWLETAVSSSIEDPKEEQTCDKEPDEEKGVADTNDYDA